MAIIFRSWEKRASNPDGDPVGSPWYAEVGWLMDVDEATGTGEVFRIRYRGTDAFDFNGQHPPRVRYHINPPEAEEFLLRSTTSTEWREENIPPPKRFTAVLETDPELGDFWRLPKELEPEFDYEWVTP